MFAIGMILPNLGRAYIHIQGTKPGNKYADKSYQRRVYHRLLFISFGIIAIGILVLCLLMRGNNL